MTSLGDGASRAGRAEREEAGVNRLLCEVFGPESERRHDASGRPWLYVSGKRQDVNISISHSRRHAVLAVAPSGVDIGVDVEEWREQLTRVAPRVLSPEELSEYGSSADGLLRGWTLKEALYKASRHLLHREPEFASQLVLPLGGRDACVLEGGDAREFSSQTVVEDGVCIALVWRTTGT
ncbi:MAG: 4'-phosphopantetheinyl transferase superfamily protein [Muribaculaceae bacterium]|nr:4'-phosphopantetheinyl transferase superfamily protein [Muribaculaceae bacterium]